MFITLVRHTSVAVPAGICYGQSDVDVSETFDTEAQKVFEKLQLQTFDAVYSSPSSRCRKLAEFCGFAQPIIDDRLMELNFGDWELKPWNGIADTQLQKWYNNWIDEPPTHGESFREMIQRVEEFFNEIKYLNNNHVIIFTHAGVIRSTNIICNKLSILTAFNQKVDYGSIFQIQCK